MKQFLQSPSFRFGFLFCFLLTAYPAAAQLGRFRKAIFKVTPREGLSNFFNVSIDLVDRHGERVTVSPGANVMKWDYFHFQSEDGVRISYGTGTFPISRNLTGKDSMKVTVTCDNSDLNTAFYVPVKYCKSIGLGAGELNYGSSVAEDWYMIMNDGSRYPLNLNWFDPDLLVNESDPAVRYQNGMIVLATRELIHEAQLRFRNAQTGELVIDQPLEVVYRSSVEFDFSGLPGRSGRNGQNSAIASETGANGENGERGLDAESVTVFLRPGSGTNEGFYEVIAIGGNHRKQTFTRPENVTLNIKARGGRGGDGGDGGKGGDAARTDDVALRRSGGNGGHGGLGGYGGDGGDVVVIIAEALKDTPIAVNVKNEGGSSGVGGRNGSQGYDPNRGLIERALIRDESQKPAVTEGASGYTGRSGTYLGTRYVSPEEFDRLLREAGWK